MKRNLDWRYLIREIFIVSIGILTAFWINTISSNISQKREIKEYRKSLIVDLSGNLKSLDKIIESQNQKVLELNATIKALESANYDLDILGQILTRQKKSPTFFPISGTFKSLVSQGKIEIFDTNIKRELFNLYDTNYARIEYNGVLYDKVYVSTYDKEILQLMNLKTNQIENIQRLESTDFIKNILLIIDEAKSYLNLLNKSKIESTKLLELISEK